MSTATTPMLITFSPALPCATVHIAGLCLKPATVATVGFAAGGTWLMQPICKDCVAALVRVYLPSEQAPQAKETTDDDL